MIFLLFNIDLNADLPEKSKLIKYADDLLTYVLFKNVKEDNTQEVIDKIEVWAKVNKMRLNIVKTKHMLINNHNNVISNVTISASPLEEVHIHEYIGYRTNSDLNYDIQWDYVAKRTNPLIYFWLKWYFKLL